MKNLLLLSFLLQVYCLSNGQHVELLTKGNNTSIRGLSVVNDKVIWVSGSNGQVGRSLNGGKSWKWVTVKSFEKKDFRDIEAFDKNTAIIMAIAEPANILKTTDGGITWRTVYENNSKGMFLDAMEFHNRKNGTVVGDPVDGRFFMATSSNAGETWTELDLGNYPVADSGEACFASSGTNIRINGAGEASFVSGGRRSRYLSAGIAVNLPFVEGTSSTGANSFAVRSGRSPKETSYMVVVGGNYAVDSVSTNNCFISIDGGMNWRSPVVPPHGYRSCVEFITQNQLVSCGTSGVDISLDAGLNWSIISTESFHVCRKAKKGDSVFLAGINGRIAKLVAERGNK